MMNKRIFLTLPFSLLGFACTDYVSEINSQHDQWVAVLQQTGNNSTLPSDGVTSTPIDETPSYIDTPITQPSTNDGSSSTVVYTGCQKSPQIIFNGACKDYRVRTGFEKTSIESGYWFSYNDNADGGKSRWIFPVQLGNIYFDDAIDPVVDYCQGFCGTISLDRGILDYNPFVGAGFNIAGPNIPTDITSWGGICVTYVSDHPLKIEMGLTDDLELYYSYDLPGVELKASSIAANVCFSWNSFKQEGWGGRTISGNQAAQMLVSLKFKVQGSPSYGGFVNIMSLSKNL